MQREHLGARAAALDEHGFTLVELMVVILIISILIAIATPAYIGASNRAKDRAAESSLRNGVAAEETVYTDNQAYSADTSAGGVLNQAESSLQWGTKLLPVVHAHPDAYCLAQLSGSGVWFALAKIGTGPDAGVYYHKDGAADPCPADPSTVGPSGAGWAATPTGAGGGW